jgi:ArsR family transcriptional regulator, arsenate/arsenite/antimonite-responsive transcriptional repressor
MSVNLNSLHKVLKDETRRKILTILSERGSASYSELMAELQIASTGKLNYHLKVLNGLISKDAEGRYRLSELGKAAQRLLSEFPHVKNELEEKRKVFYYIVALTNVLITTMAFRVLSNSRTWTFESTLLFWVITCIALVVANTVIFLRFRKSPLFASLYNVIEEDRKEATKAFLRHRERLGFVLMLGLSVPLALASPGLAPHTMDWLFIILLLPILLLIYGIARLRFHAFLPILTAEQLYGEAWAFWLGSTATILLLLTEFVMYARFNVAMLVLLATGFLSYSVVYIIGRTKRFPDERRVN